MAVTNPNPQTITGNQWEDLVITAKVLTPIPMGGIGSWVIQAKTLNANTNALLLTINTYTIVDPTVGIFSFPISSNQTGAVLGAGSFRWWSIRTNPGSIADLSFGYFTIAFAPQPT